MDSTTKSSVVTYDEFHGQGGSYVVKNGKRMRVEEGTVDHDDGNCARDADGKPLEKVTGDAEAPAAVGTVTSKKGGE